MNKQWEKKSDFNYSLWVDNNQTGTMEIKPATIAGSAICNIEGVTLEIRRAGFWKSNIEIVDQNGIVVLKTYPEKWYANSSIVEFENKKYKLIVRNNPLAEYVITENGEDLLAYGLAADNKTLHVRITASGTPNIVFDFLLWYLFLPVANENFGDTYSFLIAQ